MGLVFDIERYAIHDGPGIRTTVFLKGCPLTCLWCHNPEGKSGKPELLWSQERCIGCKTCQHSCTQGAITLSDRVRIEKKKCNLCRACVNNCPSQALEIAGREMAVEDVMKEIEKDILFYDESQGGVTFSGGEPFMQPDFLSELLKMCKKQEIHTAVDTCGYAPTTVIEAISHYVDLFLYDLKTMDDDVHKKYTGVSNALILENVKRLSATKKIIVRYPVIPDVNDDEKTAAQLGEFVASLKIRDISLLPYHRGGDEKARKLGIESPFVTQPPSEDTLNLLEKRLKAFNLHVKRGG